MTLANHLIQPTRTEPSSFTRLRTGMRLPHRRILLLLDLGTAAGAAALYGLLASSGVDPAVLIGAVGALAVVGLLWAHGSYSHREPRRPRWWPPLMALAGALVLTGALLWAGVARGLESTSQLLLAVAAGAMAVAVADLCGRLVIRAVIRPVILVVGEEASGHPLAGRLSRARVVQLRIPGNIRMNPGLLVDLIGERAVLCGAGVIELRTSEGLAGEVVRDLSWALRKENIKLRLVLLGPVLSHRRISVKVRGGDMFVDVTAPRPNWLDRLGKNLLDVLGAGLLVVMLSPLLLALSAIVKFGSKGPVFYRQVRIGLDGHPFEIMKFRSMVVDADAHLARLLEEQGSGGTPLFKLENDPRVTRIGAVMRRYSLDELPQLFNVLQRTMSLVGPRPQVPAEVELYDGPAIQRLGVRPGMTGMWQVGGRSRLSWKEALDLDLRYAHNWSVGQDLQILLQTFKAVVGGDGAR